MVVADDDEVDEAALSPVEEGVDGVVKAPPKKERKKFGDSYLYDAERGLPFLIREFTKLNFGGKGHEARDISRLMRLYREWANQLFPKLSFEVLIDRIAKLGSVAEVNAFISEERERQLEARIAAYEDTQRLERGVTSDRDDDGEAAEAKVVEEVVVDEVAMVDERDYFNEQDLIDARNDEEGPDDDEMMALNDFEMGQ